MKKRILSVLLVVAMLASMVVMPAYAAGETTQNATPSQYTDANGYCLCGCGTLWEDIEWATLSKATTLTEAGNYHYRLEADTAINGNVVYLNSTTNVMNVVFDLNGYTLRVSGRVGYIKAGNSLHIIDSVGTGAVINCDVDGYNAGLTGHWVFSQGTTTIYGGSWSNEGELPVYQTATVDNPTLIYVGAGGSLTIKDGAFDVSGMEALGAGLMGNGFITSDSAEEAVINIEDGVFTGDDSSSLGAWYIRYKGVLNISGGTFNCKVIQSGGRVTLSGDVKIEELMVQGGSIVNVEGLTSGAEIGVNASPMFAFTNVLTDADAYLDYFTNTNEEYVGDFTVVDGAIKATWSETAKCPHCDALLKDIADWKCFNTDCKPGAYASVDGTPVDGEILSGHYYLNGDIIANSAQYGIGSTEADGKQTIASRDVCLFTMGCEMNTNGNTRMFYLKAPHDLAIVNIMGRASVLSTEYKSGSGGFIYNAKGTGSTNAKRTYLQIFNCVLRNSSTDTANAKTGSVIHTSTYNTQKFENCVFAGKAKAGNGGALNCSTGATNMVDCVFYGSTNGANGAAISKSGSDFNITNCKIYGGKATYGGAICYEGSGKVTIKNSTITDGTATTDGAGIYLNNASGKGGLEIENSTIGSLTHSNHYTKDTTKAPTYNETATGAADGIVGNYTLTLKGQVNIGDLDLNEADNSAFLGFTADITAMTGGKVAVTAVADTAFTSALTDADTAKTYAAKYFTSNVDGLNVRYDDTTFELILTEGKRYGVCPHCEDQIVEWAPYAHDGNVDILASDHYYLSEIVSTDSEVAIGASDDSSTPELETIPLDVVLDLSGKDLLCANRRAFTVRNGCSLYMLDSVGGAVVTGGYTNGTGAVFSLLNDSKLTLHSGTYTQNNSKTYTRHGGIISINGGELNVINTAVVTGGTTSVNGGNIYATGGSTVTIEDNAQVIGGSAQNGGNIYATGTSTTVTIQDNAQVTGGTTAGTGGNIYAGESVTVTIQNGAQVTNGYAISHGGNIEAAPNSTVIIQDNAQLTGGFSEYRGGNIYGKTATVKLSDNAIVSGGEASDGGNMFLYSGSSLIMTGGTIKDGVARDHEKNGATTYSRGGNVYLGSDGTSTISSGTISGGISEGDRVSSNQGGGNLYLYEGGNLTISGDAVITGGSAKTAGGNIFAMGDLTLESSAVSAGTAVECGADIYIGETGAIEIALAVTGDLGIGINDNKYEGSAPYGKAILDSVYSGTDMNSELKLTLDGVRGNVPVYAQGGALWVQDGGVAVVDIDGNCEYFANPADAVAAFDQSTDMWLMACGADEIVLTKDAWIDVNGCDFTVSGDYTASFIDSSNDDYESFGWVTLNGASLGNGNSVAANTTTYYTVKGDDGRYSFHLLDMEITAVSLKTKTGGLYYEAKWYCDDTMKGQIDTFGIAANLGSMPTELVDNQFSWMNGTELVSGKAYVGATINGIIGTDEIKDADGNVISNDVRGAMKLYAAPYVWLKTGEVVMADTEVGMSLKDCCDAIDDMITELLAGDDDDKALAADYISYMDDYLFGIAWKDLELTWTFTNFQKAESAEA